MTTAARALGPVAMCARAFREEHDGAHERLAATLRDEALRVLRTQGVPAQARDDIAQGVTLKVLARIVEGAVAHGLEDGYLAVAAKNRARDYHRESSGVYDRTVLLQDEAALPANEPDPCALLLLAEEHHASHAMLDRVRSVLERAPQRYREALVAVYLEDTPIDTLVDLEMLREFDTGAEDVIAQRRRARARVDKLLQRARDWVRARLSTSRSTPPPPLPRDAR